MARLGDLTNIRTGKLDANAAVPDGQYPFFTCSKETLRIDTYQYDCECVLVAGNGDLNVKYYNGKFDAYQRTYIIESKNKNVLLVPYLYYFLDGYVETLRKQSIGGVIKYIKLGNLTEADIPLPDINRQSDIIQRLKKIECLISLHKQQLAKLDELVKARFVEMFGDPVANSLEWDTKPMLEVSPADPCKKDFDGKVWLLNLDMIEAQTGQILDYLYVDISSVGASTTTFDEGNVLYSKLRPYLNKVVIPDRQGFATTELIPLRPNNELNRIFLANLLRADSFVDFINGKVAGAKMPRVSMSVFREFACILPPLELQSKFSSFVIGVDKCKVTVRQSLDKLERLKKSLMQQYFRRQLK